jgi:ribosomal protein S24E
MPGMKSQVLEERDNPMMRRKEYWLLVEHPEQATPSRKDILGSLVRELKAKEDLLIVDKMFSEKGMAATRVKVEVYSKKEDIPRHKIEKSARRLAGKKGGDKPKEEKAAEGKGKEEAPQAKEKPEAAEKPADGKGKEQGPGEKKGHTKGDKPAGKAGPVAGAPHAGSRPVSGAEEKEA